MATELLLDSQCRRFRPRKKPYRKSDGGGLYLIIHPDGRKYWQVRYVYDGKQRLLQIGPYPEISLLTARAELKTHRAALQAGKDPVIARKFSKLQQARETRESFGAIAYEWLEHFRSDWSAVHYERNEGLLRRVLLPKLGPLPIKDIDVPALLSVLRAAEARGILMSARRARGISSQVFAYAIGTGRAKANPARELLGAMKPRQQTKHHPAIKFSELGPFLNKLEVSAHTPVAKGALLLVLYTGLRDFALRAAKWEEIDFANALWCVPKERCKGRLGKKQPHAVPLPRQAIEVLRWLQPQTDRGPDSFIFPGPGKAGCLSENTLTGVLHGLGFPATVHGFRSLLTDQLYLAQFHDRAIERQLSHADRSEVRAAYLRDDFMDHRRTMMAWWADVCDAARTGKPLPRVDNVVSIRSGA